MKTYMIALIWLLTFRTVLTGNLDPALSDWTLITSRFMSFDLPMRKYVLQVKSSLPEDYDTNPVYNETVRVDKSTTMMVELYDGPTRVGRLTWNSIHYQRGYDVYTEECNNFYVSYRNFPCGGREQQIWAWKFNRDNVELSCDDEVQYSQYFSRGDPFRNLREKCRDLGRAQISRVAVRFMEGAYVRAVPMEIVQEPTTMEFRVATTFATTGPTGPTSSPPLPGPLSFNQDFPTCNCWTPECNYCSKIECTVKQDLINSNQGISVRSTLHWGKKKLNSIVFYDEKGRILGRFQLGLSGIYLTGCIRCQTPSKLRRARAPIGLTSWVLSLRNLVLQIKINEEVLFERKLRGECAYHYRAVRRFAFDGMNCENRFLLQSDMEIGDMMTPTCSDSCPAFSLADMFGVQRMPFS
ncbi:hypothetical protein ACHWQZ_G016605 [Mnemiopsis leidyi]